MIQVEKAKRPSWRQELIETMEGNIFKYIDKMIGDKIIPNIEELIDEADLIRESGRLSEDAFSDRLDELFEELDGKIEGGIKRMSDVQVGRIWNDSQLQVGANRGFKEYMSVSERDKDVCDFCDELDGQTFSIQSAKDKIGEEQEFLSVDDLEEMEDIGEAGLRPPYHPACR